MSQVIEFATIPAAGSEPPRVVVPARASIFADRARRFNALAEGHALGDWLRFLGRLTQAQHVALQSLPKATLPDGEASARARRHGVPPLSAQHQPPDAIWRGVLRILTAYLRAQAPEAARRACAELDRASEERLEALAGRVLRTEMYGEDAALLPYVAAALQVCWTASAAAIGVGPVAAIDAAGVCPCCGSLPVASVVRTAPEVNNLRYLHCCLCNTEWNLVRIRCAACGANDKIAYRQIEGSPAGNLAAMRGETCDGCMSYLKILYQEKAPEGDPVADDLATLALDVLLDEAGYSRAGPNLLFVSGEI